MRVVDTEDRLHQPGWFVLQDIERRAEAAYAAHSDFFDSAEHTALCDTVEAMLKRYAKSYNAIYQTARAQTRKRPAHTEVKIGRVMFAKGDRHRLGTALEALGIASDDIVYKPKSQSLSVHVK